MTGRIVALVVGLAFVAVTVSHLREGILHFPIPHEVTFESLGLAAFGVIGLAVGLSHLHHSVKSLLEAGIIVFGIAALVLAGVGLYFAGLAMSVVVLAIKVFPFISSIDPKLLTSVVLMVAGAFAPVLMVKCVTGVTTWMEDRRAKRRAKMARSAMTFAASRPITSPPLASSILPLAPQKTSEPKSPYRRPIPSGMLKYIA